MARLPVGSGPGSAVRALSVDGVALGMAAGADSVWFTEISANAISRIDPDAAGSASTIDFTSTPTPQGPVYN
jgi:streptogramin lyase